MKMRTLQQGKETESSEMRKMTPAQLRVYCDLVDKHRKNNHGFNPDGAKLKELGKKARRLA